MNRYAVLSTIGSGATSVVKLAKDTKSDRFVVLKQFHVTISQLSEESKKRMEEEIAIQSSLSHPSIIQYLGSFIHDDYRVIVMEYANARSLRSYLNYLVKTKTTIPVIILKKWLMTIAEVLSYIHSQHIIHRDLKPENLLLTTPTPVPLTESEVEKAYSPESITQLRVKVADFGIAREATDMFAMTQVGTPYYIAPEVCQNRVYTNKIDMWSLGCILYELMTRKPPFQSSTIGGLFSSIIFSPTPQLPTNYPKSMCIIVQQLLSKSPDQRPSAEDILQYLKDVPTTKPQPITTGTSVYAAGRRYSISSKSPRVTFSEGRQSREDPLEDLSFSFLNDRQERTLSRTYGSGSLRSRKYTPSPSPHPLMDESSSETDEDDSYIYSLFRK
ncbi:hypothetical protein WA171_003076 [Blastocystis sp. BT1]